MRLHVLGDGSRPFNTSLQLAADAAKIPGVDCGYFDLTVLDTAAKLDAAGAGECHMLLYTPAPAPMLDLLGWFRALERNGVTTCSHHLDLYVGLRREHRVHERNPLFAAQHVFTADGDPHSAEVFAARGVNHHWLPAAIASGEAQIAPAFGPLGFDVVFVGHCRYPHPEWTWRAKMLAALARHYGNRFHAFDHDSGMRGKRLAALYASARVVVGDSLCLAGHRNYWSDRYYETVGRGGFLLAPAVPGIEAHFTDRRDLWLYRHGDVEGLLRLCDAALALQHAQRREIAQRGQERVSEHHTYVQRMEQLLEVVACG